MTIRNKARPRHKVGVYYARHSMAKVQRDLKCLLVAVVAVLGLMATPAYADMNGYDISNWQTGINTAQTPGDFVIVGTTWPNSGTTPNGLVNGVNADAQRQLDQATSAGKKTGVYAYAQTGDATQQADFFVNTVKSMGYLYKSMLILDWESQDNANFGNGGWVRQWCQRVKDLTGVNPVVYLQDSAYWQIQGIETQMDVGVWIAQYATMDPTGYQDEPWRSHSRGEMMRQYSSSGYLPGWAGRLDLDKFWGSPTDWDAYANPKKHPRTDPNPTPSTPNPVQQPRAPALTDEQMADKVIRGDYGNNPYRRVALGGHYQDVMAIVNQRLGYGGTDPSGTAVYVVKPNDYLSKIWPQDWRIIANLNGLSWPYTIYPGERLRTTGDTGSAGRTVRVNPGDTLSGIAGRLGISAGQLHGYRSGNPNLIYPGEILNY
ncbi:GH25 family lysozyme [Bifidobacterium sp. ESL0775]|uniref:GH25 family lysozyme n=1 Tax=Bifidobacterium sp. ESL0775 TaxID=2983230 RepID=UPI0023F79E23|nr:GH25 family lysozyme [Bifidobacterium sp. ESL0775]WEV68706.1 GH25 family lysozyme [Bifidobacterium sp. ESL0775]